MGWGTSPAKGGQTESYMAYGIDDSVVADHFHQTENRHAPPPRNRRDECDHGNEQGENKKTSRTLCDAIGSAENDGTELDDEEKLVAYRCDFIAVAVPEDAGGGDEVGDGMKDEEKSQDFERDWVGDNAAA